MGTSEDEEVVLDNEKIDQTDSFIYLGIISKDDRYSKNAKSRIANIGSCSHDSGHVRL